MFTTFLTYFLQVVVRYKYAAVYAALTAAGFGAPIPEEVTIVVSGYMVATGRMLLWITLLVCYLGVLSGDVATYCIGRYGGRPALNSRWTRWLITRRQLAEVQYYYRRYGAVSLLFARQLPGLRFPSFFTAGMLKMRFWRFLLFDAVAALVSMPVVFFVAYLLGPGLERTLRFVLRMRNVASVVAFSIVMVVLVGLVIYLIWTRRRRVSRDG